MQRGREEAGDNTNNNEKIESHRCRRSLAGFFQLRMPHMGHRERKERAAAGLPPKGCMAVRVGQEGEEQRRVVVPVAHLSHPLFAEFLEEAKAEYGFSQPGAISIPCGVDHFRHVNDVIDRERGSAAVHHHHLPLRLLHFACCFGA
ncbi:auxin-responsive protein SAUR32-like [Musa acuminata AAA Group]|uniref:auxin-responsive protein SAUR32-like n=2 Tax=Musa acuminata AAA Group TaxID=214697 RepID=UPI0031DEE2D4